jgi:hypothetical protein
VTRGCALEAAITPRTKWLVLSAEWALGGCSRRVSKHIVRGLTFGAFKG